MIGNKVRIVGVVKDFHFLSAHNSITPMIIHLYNSEETGWNISVRIKGNNKTQTLEYLNLKFAEIFPAQLFDYEFVTSGIEKLYREEMKLAGIVLYLSILAIFIACLGVYGLISFSTAARNKEIGIRKVLGSGLTSINLIFFKEYFGLIIIANIIAWPISYWGLNQWIQSFPYQVEYSLIPSVVALVLTIFFAIISMMSKTIYATKANPVDSLRYE